MRLREVWTVSCLALTLVVLWALLGLNWMLCKEELMDRTNKTNFSFGVMVSWDQNYDKAMQEKYGVEPRQIVDEQLAVLPPPPEEVAADE